MGHSAASIPGPVNTDVICLGCGYNLQALDPAGHCPECNAPIARSIHGDLVRYADARWRGRLILGLRLVYVGLFVAVGTAIVSIAATIVAESLYAPPELLIGGIIALAAFVSLVAAPIMIIIGWWFAGARDPAENESTAVHRGLLRATGMLVLPTFAVWMSLRFLPWPPIAIEAIALACFGLVTVHLHALGRFMRRLFGRCVQVDDRRARRRQRIIGRIKVYCIVVPALVLGLHVLMIALSLGTRFPATATMGWGRGVGFLLMFLLWISITSNLNGTLRELRREADAAAEAQLEQEGAASDVPHSERRDASAEPDRS